MITDAAVEAAAKRSYAAKFGDGWEGVIHKRGWLYEARQALEAAAPHMQSRAWEEGYGLGYSDHMWDKGHEPRARNPYR